MHAGLPDLLHLHSLSLIKSYNLRLGENAPLHRLFEACLPGVRAEIEYAVKGVEFEKIPVCARRRAGSPIIVLFEVIYPL